MTNFDITINALKSDDNMYKFNWFMMRGWDVDARLYLQEITGATEETARTITDLYNAGELRCYL